MSGIETVRVREATGEKPPLLVLLHGLGADENDLFSLTPWLDERFTVVAPRAPLRYPPGYGWYPVQFTPQGIVFDENAAFAQITPLLELIDRCHRTYGTDPKRTYLMGFSQGAAMSLLLLLTQPAHVAGAVLMSGRLIPQAAERAAHYMELVAKPVFVCHGLYDTLLPIDQGRAIRDELARYPVFLTYNEYPMGHEVTPESIAAIQQFLTEVLDSPPSNH